MSETNERLEAVVADLQATVGALELRVASLEGSAAIPVPGDRRPAEPAPAAPTETTGPPASLTPAGILALLGRACLVFCGAFLLRAITDAGAIPPATGIALGLAYAVLWLVAADRAGRSGRQLSAEFHGTTAVMIGYPLIVEATGSFHVLGVAAAAAALAALTAFGLAVAWVRRLPALAWASSLACSATALVLIRVTYRSEPFAVVLVALGLATAWLAYARGWHGIRWATAFAADLVVFHMSIIAARPGPPRPPFDTFSIPATTAIALALFTLYLASIAVRTLVRHRNVTAFEAVQTAAVLVIGFGGAARIARVTGAGLGILGVTAMALGLASYAVAFVSVDRRSGRNRNFFFFTSSALVLLVYGSAVAVPHGLLASLLGVFALATAVLGGRFDRVTLRAHAAVYVICGAVVSGMLSSATSALVTATGSLSHFTPSALVAVASACISYVVLAATQLHVDTSWKARLPRFVTSLVAVLGIGALIVVLAGRVLVGDATNLAAMAAIRSVVLAGAALALAATGGRATHRELGWLVYPVLAAGGLKLLLDDLQHGRPATLFVSFACYGLALIVAPRLLKRASSQRAP